MESAPDARVPATAEALIEALGLEAHVEGGFFRRLYSGDAAIAVVTEAGVRPALTSIQYALTSASPVGHFHRNRSTIVHYFQLGDPLTYRLLDAEGNLETRVLGPDLAAGHRLELVVPGGVWKSSELEPGPHGYGLVAEAVSPGFDYADMSLAQAAELERLRPDAAALLRRLCRA